MNSLAGSLTIADVQRIRQNAIFDGPITRTQVLALADDWLAHHKEDS